MKLNALCVAVAAAALLMSSAAMAKVNVIGGELTWDLDLQALEQKASNTLSGVSPLVDADFTNGIFNFPIQGPDNAPFFVSTLSYDPGDPFATFEGEIATLGTLFFEGENMVLGTWASGAPSASGDFSFYNAEFSDFPVFDATTNLSTAVADTKRLFLEGDLLAASAFAATLLDLGLATEDITGTKLGTYQVEAIVTPLPGGIVILGTAVAVLGAVRARAKRQHREAT